MSNQNYYYLVSSLPKLRLDDHHERYRLADFVQDLEEHLINEHLGFAKDILSMQEVEGEGVRDFYNKMTNHANQFIREYFQFDQDLRNILIALNKKKFSTVLAEYMGSEEDGTILALKSSSLGDFGLGTDLSFLPGLIEMFQSGDIVKLEKHLDSLRWDKIEEINTFKYFEIDVLLGYLIKMMAIERWLGLIPQQGGEIFQQRIAASLAAA